MAESFNAALGPEIASGDADILVVDDTPANLLALEATLSDLAPRVVRASSGAEALRLLLDQDFGLILLDVQMPTMDGLETARLIRGRTRTRTTPIIFITAYHREEESVREAYELGAVDFLFKPIVTEMLRAKVTAILELQRRRIEVMRQAAQLRDHERREHERSLTHERERWQAEMLQRRVEQLADADRRKDEFIALLSHELRNPLSPILTGLELLRGRFSEPARVDESMRRTRDVMERQVRHLVRLVEDLLDASRVSSGRIELRLANVLLSDVVERAVQLVQPAIEERQHRLIVTRPDESITLNADADRLTQVLSNLLTNAVRYTPAAGVLELRCAVDGAFVVIRMIDNGRGVTPELLPRVFGMFVQEHRGNQGGLGVGLALVKRLVELHHGTVEAHSEGQGRGSEFIVRLPLPARAADHAIDPAPARSLDGNTASAGLCVRIVVIEDNQDVRDALQQQLTVLGHSVEVAGAGEAGAALILRTKPDVALVDIGLPDIDGFEVARRVREQFDRNEVRLVATTGFGQESARQRARDAGFDDYLIKPPDQNTLQTVLSEVQKNQHANSIHHS